MSQVAKNIRSLGQWSPWSSRSAEPANSVPETPAPANTSVSTGASSKMSTWGLITLSLGMLGAQIAWTVELGYGTPFLLQLGISEQLTSLVWLAAPISGLIAQPMIGAISDASPSKYRRRFWIILSTAVLVLSTLVLAYCEALAAFFVDLFQVGQGDWDASRDRSARNAAITLAVVSFYFLDFALNGLQASLRNLLLDVTPATQLSAGNAWHSRMTNAGNIIGYGFGFFPLAKLPFLRWIGGSQFRKFCIVCIVILVITVWVTCYCHEEKERPEARQRKKSQLREIFGNIYRSALRLPRSIRRVCVVQLFAFMGWFPFLFYATTYVGQVMAAQIGKEPNPDLATRKGELALLLNSLVSTVAGFTLPVLASRNRHLLAHKEDVDEDAELTRLRNTVKQWRIESVQKGKPLRLPYMPFLLRNIWSFSLLLFSLLTWTTFFVHDVAGATAFVSLVGISWAVAMWAPFAIIMELVKDQTNSTATQETGPSRPGHSRNYSSPVDLHASQNERQPLLRRHRSFDEAEDQSREQEAEDQLLAGGTILGIHNMAIVMPQFLVALTSSIIFRIVDGEAESADPTEPTAYYGRNGVAWVLRFGGLCTFLGAFVARMVPPTPTEKEMRRRLAEMRFFKQEEQDLYT